jgi:hypothetical protein
MQAIKDLLKSEKAVACGALAIGATVMVFLDRLTADQWMAYTQVIAGIYVGGKAIQGAASEMRRSSEAKALAANPEGVAKIVDAAGSGLDGLMSALKSNDAKADALLASKKSDSDASGSDESGESDG